MDYVHVLQHLAQQRSRFCSVIRTLNASIAPNITEYRGSVSSLEISGKRFSGALPGHGIRR
jgi:hypothetical protein